MDELRYRLTFISPAFLGDAQQSAQWRTPPIKALLRQWWRVVYAADCRHRADLDRMRECEGRLFGIAADGDGLSRRSRLRLRIDEWRSGTLHQWEPEPARVPHPEVGHVGPHLYLGFGPLTYLKGSGTVLTGKDGQRRSAIPAGDSAELAIACLEPGETERIRRALALAHRYGTVGGRSRNGWGSLALTPSQDTPPLAADDSACLLDWSLALQTDWAQAIGRDSRGALVWQTPPHADWRTAMVALAQAKIALRTRFRFPQAHPDGCVHDRHWLAYPVTRHDVTDWKRDNLRLPNTLRFKLRRDPDKRVRGIVFHMPCLPPPAFAPDRSRIDAVWRQVHEQLNDLLQRISA